MDKKRKLKKIESLKKQIKIHKQKIREYSGNKSHLLDYWEKEVKRFEDEVKEEENSLK